MMNAKLALPVMLLALAGCGKSPSNDGDAASASAAPSAPTPFDPVADRETIMRALCDKDDPVHASGSTFACRCPYFADSSKQGEMTLGPVCAGAFTAPGQVEAVVGLSGCSRPSLDRGPVKTFGAFVRKMPYSIQRIQGFQEPMSECQAFGAKDGVSLLLTRSGTRGVNDGFMREYFNQVSYRGNAGSMLSPKSTGVFSYASNDPATVGPDYQGPLSLITVRRFEVIGREAFAKGDASEVTVAVDVDAESKCIGPTKGCGTLPAPRSFPLRFQTGASFDSIHPAEDTKPLLEALGKREPTKEHGGAK